MNYGTRLWWVITVFWKAWHRALYLKDYIISLIVKDHAWFLIYCITDLYLLPIIVIAINTIWWRWCLAFRNILGRNPAVTFYSCTLFFLRQLTRKTNKHRIFFLLRPIPNFQVKPNWEFKGILKKGPFAMAELLFDIAQLLRCTHTKAHN